MSDKNQQAILAHSPILSDSGDTPRLDVFLTYARNHSSEDVQGLAFATNGTWTVLGFDKVTSTGAPKLTVAPIDGREFDPTKVFELRLWVPVKLPDEPAEGDVLAHEYRWVNDVGAVDLRVTAGTESSPSTRNQESGNSSWVYAVQYLEHVPSTRSTANHGADSTDNQSNQTCGGNGGSRMTALEFIQEEDKYGNTVVIDQLFTGKWN